MSRWPVTTVRDVTGAALGVTVVTPSIKTLYPGVPGGERHIYECFQAVYMTAFLLLLTVGFHSESGRHTL